MFTYKKLIKVHEHYHIIDDNKIKMGELNISSDYFTIDVTNSDEDLQIVNDKRKGYKRLTHSTDKTLPGAIPLDIFYVMKLVGENGLFFHLEYLKVETYNTRQFKASNLIDSTIKYLAGCSAELDNKKLYTLDDMKKMFLYAQEYEISRMDQSFSFCHDINHVEEYARTLNKTEWEIEISIENNDLNIKLL